MSIEKTSGNAVGVSPKHHKMLTELAEKEGITKKGVLARYLDSVLKTKVSSSRKTLKAKSE